MAVRYELEVLLHLQNSPLCVKPKDLPPREEWMGYIVHHNTPLRVGGANSATGPHQKLPDRPPKQLPIGSRRTIRCSNLEGAPASIDMDLAMVRSLASALSSQGSSRFSRLTIATGSDGLVLGPPRTAFSSSTLRAGTSAENDRGDKTPRDPDARDRFSRGKIGAAGEGEGGFRGGRLSTFRARGEDRDSEGWVSVKPRKSFGQEGAERFTGRMGGDHRHRDDRGPKERDDHDGTKDRRRNFDVDGEEGETPRRNGLNRGRTEPWHKETVKAADTTERERASNRERIEKAKSWRTHDNDDSPRPPRNERGNDRYDRRWADKDRDQRPNEREPEWLDEPAEEKNIGHTEADLKKFMESMKAGRSGPKASDKAPEVSEGPPALPAFFTSDPPAVKSAPAVERGKEKDKFFAMFSETQAGTASPVGGEKAEAAKAPAVKSSRFANLFSAQSVEPRGSTEPPTPAAMPPPPPSGGSIGAQQSDAERDAFQALLSKLHLPRPNEPQSTPTPPSAGPYALPPSQKPFQQPQHVPQDHIQHLEQSLALKVQIDSPEPRLVSAPPARPDILAPRPAPPPSQPPSARPDQMLQDLVNQRHNAQSQGSGRPEPDSAANAVFLMKLMQSGRQMPDARPIEQLMRHPQPQRSAPIPQFQDREPDFGARDRIPAQRQMRPPQGGFIEEQFRRSEGDGRPIQPIQILQRPPMGPPGLDQGMQQLPWMQPGQQAPPNRQPMIPQPPPGLANPNRNGPMPGMFNPNMPPNVFAPDNIPGPPRNMQPPPGFFAGVPPPGPGFMPGPPGMGGFPGPEGMIFQSGLYDGRGGMPPPGAAPFRR